MVKFIVDLDTESHKKLKQKKLDRDKSSINETAEEILSEVLNA